MSQQVGWITFRASIPSYLREGTLYPAPDTSRDLNPLPTRSRGPGREPVAPRSLGEAAMGIWAILLLYECKCISSVRPDVRCAT